MRRLTPLLLLLGAAAPPLRQPMTPLQAAGDDMIQVYEEFCLSRFPHVDMLKDGVTRHKLPPASAANAAEALQGRHGKAWAITTPKGSYTIAITAKPVVGCVVTGVGEDTDNVRTLFNIAVQGLAVTNKLGKMDFPELKHFDIAGRPATLQLIGTLGEKQRQAFVNLSLSRPDGTPIERLSREFAPEAAQ
jgi:hypothetical protein